MKIIIKHKKCSNGNTVLLCLFYHYGRVEFVVGERSDFEVTGPELDYWEYSAYFGTIEKALKEFEFRISR